MTFELNVPSLRDQQRLIYEQSTKHAISVLNKNLQAPVLPGQTELDETAYSNAHLLREHEGFEAPHADIVAAYFRHFQAHFAQYGTDKSLAQLLGLESDRRIRAFKSGEKKVPYNVWRRFLVLTGRVPQDVVEVLAFMA